MDLWFPHVPLALAVGGAGSLALLPTIRQYAAEYLHLDLGALLTELQPVSGDVPRLILSGVPTTVVGILQIVIALGLLARSRIAWLSALCMTVAQFALAIDTSPDRLVTYQTVYVASLLIALWSARYWFDRTSLAAATVFALFLVLVLMVYGVLGAFLLGAGFTPPITNLPTAFYFTIVTMSTVGYGDIVPKSTEARLFVASLIVLGLTVFATALTAVVGPAVQSRINRTIGQRRKPMNRVNHFIITGDGAIAHNTARELLRRGEPVLVIAGKAGATFDNAEVMVGDPTELDVLRTAGAEHARAVLALSDDDSENAFVILAMHELVSDAKKVAAVSSRKNLDRVRRVRPDMVLAAPVFGSEALAMALTEEKIDGDWLLSRFLDVKPDGS
jgi:voltage-gated potassium channel